MISYKATTAVIGALIFLTILLLVRKGKLQEKHALTWFGIGIVVVVLGIFPVILDRIAQLTGVSYAPALLLVIAVGVLLIQNLYLFIFASQNEIRIKKLLQEVAVLNRLVADLREEATYHTTTGPKTKPHKTPDIPDASVADVQEPGGAPNAKTSS